MRFLSFLTEYLNCMNKKLQGSHHIRSLYSAINAFVWMVELFKSDLNSGNIKFFSHLKQIL